MKFNPQQLLERLESCDECSEIEAKEARAALGRSVLETISSFSNEPQQGGGYLFLGLKQNDNKIGRRYSVSGVEDPDKIQTELATLCREQFNVVVRPKIKTENIDGAIVVVAHIPEALCGDKPVFIKTVGAERGAYRRIGSSDHRCTWEETPQRQSLA